MPRLLSPEAEFKMLAARGTDDFAREFQPLLRAIVSESPSERDRARRRLAVMIGLTMALADLYGRRRALLEFDAAVSGLSPKDAQLWRGMSRPSAATSAAVEKSRAPVAIEKIQGAPSVRGPGPSRIASRGSGPSQVPPRILRVETPVVPNVPFSEAYADILRREPRLASTAEEVAKLYREKHAFALAKSADLALTKAVQGHIAAAIKAGTPALSASAILQGLGDFTRSYAQTVYSTNLTTAYTAGRFQQAQEHGVRQMLPALERWEVMDSVTRSGRVQDGPKGGVKENHAAAHGLIADTLDPIWNRAASPSGYG